MPRVSSDSPPRICAAIDAALEDAYKNDRRLTNAYLAEQVGVSPAAVGRWRSHSEPSRDQLELLEKSIGRPLGYISRLAGYVETECQDLPNRSQTEYVIAHDTRFNDAYREMLLGVVKQAVAGTRAERKRQAEYTRHKRA